MSKTSENLASAFAGESQANRRYLAFSQKASEQGMEGVAKIFRVAAEGETVHAHNHLRNMAGVKETAENINAAIAGETWEIDEMYPGFINKAQEEGDKKAEISFQWAIRVEKVHQEMFQAALAKIKADETVKEAKYFVCPVCGYPAKDEAPDFCPICGTKKELFNEVL
jgi:rubrerythrin